jgi:methylenetetrahydrofolate dehydrogenase (NADP+) / methenyltetrahydrofolate cyclohydrolase
VTATLIDGRKISEDVRADVRKDVAALKDAGVTPGLAVVLVGEDPASAVYVRMKGKRATEAGFHSVTRTLPAETTEGELLDVVDALNKDPAIHGILVQLPLPAHIDEDRILWAIDPLKDVDGFHPVNQGLLLQGRPRFVAATPRGVQEMLVRHGVETSGKHAVIVGRSNIVGKPLAALLVAKGRGGDCTVTIAHSRTRNLEAITRDADILIAAVGQPGMITGQMVKPGATVIDVGINRVNGELVGDVAFDDVQAVAGAITPVPGGVGPMTIASLLQNTVQAARFATRGE